MRNGFGVVPHERTSEVDYSEIKIVFIVGVFFFFPSGSDRLYYESYQVM